MLPVVEDISGGTSWPSGSGQVRIVGFAYFVILQPGYTNGGKTVVGTFVGIQGPQTGWITGAYNPHKQHRLHHRDDRLTHDVGWNTAALRIPGRAVMR